MRNIDKATQLLASIKEDGSYQDMPDPEWLAEKWSKSGLLAHDLPEPKESDDGEAWQWPDQETWVEKNEDLVYLNVPYNTNIYSPAEARELAHTLLAAAEHAEKVNTNDAT